MLTHSFQDLQLSALGFGTMRLPTDESGEIDQAQLDRMVDTAIASGINYFDTAYPYHGGKSEIAVGKSLSRYPRESWYLADKFPGHQNVPGVTPLDPEEVFEDQLKKCGVDYFDFYLLHNVNESSLRYYGNPENRFMDFFLEQKRKGRIRHLGFSCHAAAEALSDFLNLYGQYMEFCQIQLNYLDWTLQNAEKKCAILKQAGIPVWVMEPVRGGKLASFDAETNIRTFSDLKPLNNEEQALIKEIAGKVAKFIPCTGCRYCCAGCPMGLDIPTLLSMANDMAIHNSMNTVARYGGLEKEKRADACIGCGQCAEACPQKINVPEELHKLSVIMAGQKTWDEICRERAEAAALAKNSSRS